MCGEDTFVFGEDTSVYGEDILEPSICGYKYLDPLLMCRFEASSLLRPDTRAPRRHFFTFFYITFEDQFSGILDIIFEGFWYKRLTF